jgi:hypothetical protein
VADAQAAARAAGPAVESRLRFEQGDFLAPGALDGWLAGDVGEGGGGGCSTRGGTGGGDGGGSEGGGGAGGGGVSCIFIYLVAPALAMLFAPLERALAGLAAEARAGVRVVTQVVGGGISCVFCHSAALRSEFYTKCSLSMAIARWWN